MRAFVADAAVASTESTGAAKAGAIVDSVGRTPGSAATCSESTIAASAASARSRIGAATTAGG